MIIDLNLCSTPIEPFNTLYFENKQAQKDYFESVTRKTIRDCSYNGSRAIRINMNYLQLTNLEYNYLYFEYDNRVYYCFIDDYSYINDNCSAVNVTIDYIQTYMFDYQLKKSLVKSQTFKEEFLNNSKPYTKYSTGKYITKEIKNINKSLSIQDMGRYGETPERMYLVWFAVTFKKGSEDKYFAINPTDFNIQGKTYPLSTLFAPYMYRPSNGNFIPVRIGYKNQTASRGDVISSIIESEELSTRVEDISIIWYNPFPEFDKLDYRYSNLKGLDTPANPPFSYSIPYKYECVATEPLNYNTVNGMLLVPDSAYFNNVALATIGNYLIPYGIDVASQKFTREIDLQYEIKYSPKHRIPYNYFVIGNQNNTIEINYEDFTTLKSGHTYNHKLIITQAPLYPFNMNIELQLIDVEDNSVNTISNKNLQFSFNTTSPFPYSVSAWSQYYATHKASVDDGLATQQKYDREIAKRNLGAGITKGAISTGIGIVTGGATIGIGSMVGGRMMRMGLETLNLGSMVAGQNTMDIAQIRGGMQIGSSVANGTGGLIGSIVAYQNTLTEQEKQRALLEIQWNDYKSSPDVVSSIEVSFLSQLYFRDLGIRIFDISCVNIEDINTYHKIYGYDVSIFADINIKNHTVFDYIAINDVNIYSLLPSFITDQIVAIYESGIRFWYNEATFLNYDVDNTEV